MLGFDAIGRLALGQLPAGPVVVTPHDAVLRHFPAGLATSPVTVGGRTDKQFVIGRSALPVKIAGKGNRATIIGSGDKVLYYAVQCRCK
jgi:hypothetical protein